MCAKSARANLGLATSHIPADYSSEFKSFVDWQKMLYKKYSGYLLGVGIVASTPTKDSDSNRWMADIDQLTAFTNPIYIDEFRSFISVSKTNSITYLNNEQWERLKWIVNQNNPGFFENVIAPDVKVIEEEFQILPAIINDKNRGNSYSAYFENVRNMLIEKYLEWIYGNMKSIHRRRFTCL